MNGLFFVIAGRAMHSCKANDPRGRQMEEPRRCPRENQCSRKQNLLFLLNIDSIFLGYCSIIHQLDRWLMNQRRVKRSWDAPANVAERQSDFTAGKKKGQFPERAKAFDLTNILGADVRGRSHAANEKNRSQTLQTPPETEANSCYADRDPQHSGRGNVPPPENKPSH